jgi:hypothetical protein
MYLLPSLNSETVNYIAPVVLSVPIIKEFFPQSTLTPDPAINPSILLKVTSFSEKSKIEPLT